MYDEVQIPESDEEHVYGSLVGSNPHLYGTLISPNSNVGDVNCRNDDRVHECTDNAIESSEGGIYQQLNQAGQQSPGDIYQPLRYPGNALDMNKLTESS